MSEALINRLLAQGMLRAVKDTDRAIKMALDAERERCAKIAEIPYMTPKDIARAIRDRNG